MKAILAALERRLINMIAAAIVRRVEDNAKIQRLQVDLVDEETASAVPRMQQYGFTSVPLDGAAALVLFLGGSRDHGVAVATEDGRHRPRGLAAGDVALYDNRGQIVKLTTAGVVIDTPLPVLVKAPAGITLEGDVAVTGDLTALTATTPLSLATVRSTYNGHTHNENDVGGPTNPPNQQI